MRASLRSMFLPVSLNYCAIFFFCAMTAVALPAQTLTTLLSFDGADGFEPESPLIQGTDGNFYGTTTSGGGNGYGTVFEVTAQGTLSTLHSFNGTDGNYPQGALVQGTDGNFYGTTNEGGNYSGNCTAGCGTVFKITPGGSLTTLYSFCSQPDCTDGSRPGVAAGLAQGTDGNLYGTTAVGGTNGHGTVFKLTLSGTLTTLYSFNSADGAGPDGALVQGTDGNFYGVTYAGGGNGGYGTVFKITPSGALSTLHSFDLTDGSHPAAGLVQGTDGNFYGTTAQGGSHGDGGTVFKITPNGGLTTLYNFCSQFDCADGSFSAAALIQATDGNFYGEAALGGDVGYGTAFEITPSGTLTTLYNYGGVAGGSPYGGLVQATNGNFYGTTSIGGSYNNCNSGCGTVFSLTGPSPTALQSVPVTPCRLVDTRQTRSPIQGGMWQVFIVPLLGGCNIPATATAYSLNVTVVPHTTLGYLTIWPAERPQPNVSTMNSPDGRIKANAAIVPAGASAAVSVYVTDTTDIILDIDGYFTTPNSQTLQFYPLTPCRVVDTRGPDGGLGGPYLQGQHERDFPVLESSCDIPNAATAYSMNFTVLPKGSRLGYLTVWPAGETQPQVSTLNDPTGTNVANAALIPAGNGGAIATYVSDDTDLLVDVNGYFAPPGSGGLSFYTLAPCRVLDTRSGGGQPFSGEKTISVQTSPCGPPATSAAYVFNATALPNAPLYFLTLWPDGSPQPTVSTLNAKDGAITSNMAIVPNTDGKTDAWAQGTTQLILDISGYFAP